MTQEDRGREAVAALPATIRIGLFDFTIDKWPPQKVLSERKWGACSVAEFRISIQRDMPSAAKAVDTFLHEITHAIYWASDLGDEEKEEHVVGHISTGLAMAFRDNPWLGSWIDDALNPEPEPRGGFADELGPFSLGDR